MSKVLIRINDVISEHGQHYWYREYGGRTYTALPDPLSVGGYYIIKHRQKHQIRGEDCTVIGGDAA